MRMRAGFTLIELTVVLLIIAIAAGVTVPALLGEPVRDDVEVAGEQLDKLFRIARDSAQRSGAPVTVSFDSLTGMVWVASMADTVTFDIASTLAGFMLPLPPSVRVELTKSRAHFTFSPTGAVFGDTIMLRTPLALRTV